MIPIGRKLVTAGKNPCSGRSPSEQRSKDVDEHRHAAISIRLEPTKLVIACRTHFSLEQAGHTASKSRWNPFKNEHRRSSFVICRNLSLIRRKKAAKKYRVNPTIFGSPHIVILIAQHLFLPEPKPDASIVARVLGVTSRRRPTRHARRHATRPDRPTFSREQVRT